MRAWWAFWARSWAESVEAARLHSRAAGEVHALHAALFLGTGDPRAAISWAMAWTHVGLLPAERGLGVPNTLSLVRANLPIIAPSRPRLVAVVAVLTDLADGAIARASGGVTPFGAYADTLADVVFWMWFARRYEARAWLRRAAILFWLVPPVALTAAALVGGRMPVVPRPTIVRTLSAALQSTLTIRALRR
ncbi:MAG: CDP-alcohol phosphatidyltransferase family protein [Dehalococcoidia bacterium]